MIRTICTCKLFLVFCRKPAQPCRVLWANEVQILARLGPMYPQQRHIQERPWQNLLPRGRHQWQLKLDINISKKKTCLGRFCVLRLIVLCLSVCLSVISHDLLTSALWSSGGRVVKLLACGARGPGFDSRPRHLNFQRLVISCFQVEIWLKYR